MRRYSVSILAARFEALIQLCYFACQMLEESTPYTSIHRTPNCQIRISNTRSTHTYNWRTYTHIHTQSNNHTHMPTHEPSYIRTSALLVPSSKLLAAPSNTKLRQQACTHASKQASKQTIKTTTRCHTHRQCTYSLRKQMKQTKAQTGVKRTCKANMHNKQTCKPTTERTTQQPSAQQPSEPAYGRNW